MKNENDAGIYWHEQQHEHYQAASGYLELQMHQDAWNELNKLDPAIQSLRPVLALKIVIYYQLRDWESMQATARKLVKLNPDDARWKVSEAFATLRLNGIEAGKEILEKANEIHPNEPLILYNLSCYESQLGNLESSKEYFKQAMQVNPHFHEFALEELRLESL